MFQIELKGLDELQRHAKEADKVAETLDGELGTLRFDRNDPADVQRAIEEMERTVDARVSPFPNNPFLAQMVEATKKMFRDEILRQAQEARGRA